MKPSNGTVNLLLTSGTGYLSSHCLISLPYLAGKKKCFCYVFFLSFGKVCHGFEQWILFHAFFISLTLFKDL